MKMMTNKLSGLTFLFLLIGLLFTGCKENVLPPAPEDLSSEINLSSAGFLVDGNNQTLYIFSNDVAGANTCEGGCAAKWPVYYSENLSVGAGLESTDFAEITLADGDKQSTYNGWPIYYFSPNGDGTLEDAGATSGEGVGGVWFVAKKYDLMIANTQLVGADGVNYTSEYVAGDGSTMYYTDGKGNTLYTFSKDFKDTNNFTAADFSNDAVWPIYNGEVNVLPSAMNTADFGTITVYGQTQLTYKGWPLYYFGQDAARGDNKGVSFPAPGVWPIANANTEMAADAPTVKLVEDADFGSIIADANGVSLYFFTKDVNGTNHCTGGCENVWPVFYTETLIFEEGSNLSMDDFATITLSDGMTKQSTYKGWPLYYYSPTADGTVEAAGETAGDGVNNVWYIAKPNYSLMIADAQLVGADDKNYLSDYTEGEGVTKYFVDAEGRTLYIFTNDAKDTNNFTAADFSNDGVWPIYYTSITDVPSGMNAVDFGEIDVHGRMQLTFKGWPVYYFGSDVARGDNKGVSVPTPGVWPIINNDTPAAN